MYDLPPPSPSKRVYATEVDIDEMRTESSTSSDKDVVPVAVVLLQLAEEDTVSVDGDAASRYEGWSLQPLRVRFDDGPDVGAEETQTERGGEGDGDREAAPSPCDGDMI